MSLVKDFMTKNVITIDLQRSVFDATLLMSEKRVSCLVIVDEEVPVGIVTERDIVRRVTAKNLPLGTKISDIMSMPLMTVDPNLTIKEGAKLMAKCKIRRLPVVKENILLGIIVASDFARQLSNKIVTEEFLEAITRSPVSAIRETVNPTYVVAGIIVMLLGVLSVTWINKGNPQIMLIVNDAIKKYGLIGVFVATAISGTIIPFGSSIVIVLASGLGLPIIPLTFVAASGSTLGATTSYLLAHFLREKYVLKRMSQETFQRLALKWNRKGYWLCIIFSLVPGFPIDLLAPVCGIFKTKIWFFLPISWVTQFFQFATFAWLGKLVGSLII